MQIINSNRVIHAFLTKTRQKFEHEVFPQNMNMFLKLNRLFYVLKIVSVPYVNFVGVHQMFGYITIFFLREISFFASQNLWIS